MSVSITQHKNFVGGEWVDAASGETMEVLNPATGEAIAEVPRAGAEDVERAVKAAGKAFAEWSEKTPKDRMELLLKLADVIDEHAEELTQLESQNVGKPMSIAGDEMPFSADNLRFFAGAARTLEGKAAGEYVEGYTSIIRREPLGIVAGITPWNYPLMMAVWKLGPALAAGNVQILKPAEQTPLTTLRFVELAQEFLPPGVLQVITGDGVPAGDALVRHPEIRLISLTGSVETGKLIATGAAQSNLKRVHLELGGKAPMVVLDDADPATVAEAIKIGGYWNSGQDCTASSRILVHKKVYDDVMSETVKALEAMKVADPAEGDDVDMGPVISREQQERVLGFLERAVECEGDHCHGRRGDRGPRLLRQADRRRGRRPGLGDRPGRGLRPGRDRAALRLRRRGDRDGQRRPLRARRLGLQPRRRACAVGRPQARVRHRLGERTPLPARLRDAARRLQGVGLRQGHVALLDGGIHARQARRREAVVTQGVLDAETEIDRSRLAALTAREIEAFAAARPRSRALSDRARASLLGGVPMTWMMRWPGPYPVFLAEAQGARVVDVDGHEYVDLCLGDTGAMAGHAPAPVVRAVAEQAARGITAMLPTEDAAWVGEELARRFGLPLWQFTLSATDANRFAIRMARAVTGRPKILVFNGCYHGTVDETFATLRADGSVGMRRGNVGPPVDPALTTKVVELNDLGALEAALAPGDVACVLAEPALTNIGIVLPDRGFHDALRELTRRTATLLIIDETHTFSAGPGGYTAAHGLEPDLLTIGKAIGGGVPVGAFGVSEQLARQALAQDDADYEDVGGVGGTLAGNALSLAAVRATLGEVLTAEAFARMIALGERLADGVAGALAAAGLPWHVTQLGARAEYRFTRQPPRNGGESASAGDEELERFLHLYTLNRGVLITPFHNMALVCPATTEADVDRHTEVFADALGELA